MTNKPETVGVIGAGVMGGGVAQCFAQAGHNVVLVDIAQDILDKALSSVREGLRLQKLLGTGRAVVVPGDAIARIHATVDYEALSDCSFIVENATEDWEIKRAVYARLAALSRADCVVAANTSAFSITRIGRALGRPAHTLGLHFMNPVPMKPVVELIRGYHTSDATVTYAQDLLATLGKRCITVNDSPGFVSNRVLMLTVNEAAFLVHEGVSNASDIDELFRECFGHKMGPLATADLIGLDTVLQSLHVLYDSFADPKFRPCPLLTKLVDAGLHGRKTGRGFHAYAKEVNR